MEGKASSYIYPDIQQDKSMGECAEESGKKGKREGGRDFILYQSASEHLFRTIRNIVHSHLVALKFARGEEPGCQKKRVGDLEELLVAGRTRKMHTQIINKHQKQETTMIDEKDRWKTRSRQTHAQWEIEW